MEGENCITLMGRPEDGDYVINMPNIYARGILFGKTVIELGDACTAHNDSQDLHADAIAGRVRHGPTDLGEVSGWGSALMEFKSTETGEKRTLFDVQKHGSVIVPEWVAPENAQEPYESCRLWRDLTRVFLAKDMDAATATKGAVENAQPALNTRRASSSSAISAGRPVSCFQSTRRRLQLLYRRGYGLVQRRAVLRRRR